MPMGLPFGNNFLWATLTIDSLNDQHRFLVGIAGHHIHPSIPKGLTAIADLGTGTGYVTLHDPQLSTLNSQLLN